MGGVSLDREIRSIVGRFGDDPGASLRSINSDALDILNVRDTWGKKVLQSSAPDRRDDAGNTRETNLHFAWQVTGNTDYLNQVLCLADRNCGQSGVYQSGG